MVCPVPREALDRILPRVVKPARYTGGELNCCVKPWADARVHLLLAFPEVYEIGMSNLGMAILYDRVNARPDMLAERAFAPWPDMAAEMRRAAVPLYGLESRHPAAAFEVIGMSLGYELNFATALEMLDLAGLPLWASERDDTAPLVIAGGAACFNPEPVSAFFDLIVIGDGEEVLPELLEAYADFNARRGDVAPGSRERRRAFLRQVAPWQGVYVPEFYVPRYSEGGRFVALEPVEAAARPWVVPRMVRPLPPPPVKPIVPYLETVHDRAVVEVRRGCGQGCRFCQAGMVYRPVRERPISEIVEAATAVVANTGYDELGLLSLSTCDYRGIEDLLVQLLERFGENVAISLPSLRVDSFSLRLAEMVQTRRRSGLTFAPEAGTQRLRDAINKKASAANLYEVAEAAFSRKWQRVKLYFMLGLPTETDEDVEGIVEMATRVLAIGRRYHRGRASVSVSVSTFVPKPHTPFQWAPLIGDADLERRLGILRRGLRGRGLELSWHDPRVTRLEALLSRGGRRLARVIHRAWQLGARFDAWEEQLRWDAWQQALAEAGIDATDEGYRAFGRDEPLPWDFVRAGVRRSYLEEEYRRSLAGEVTPDCFDRCSACGVSQQYGVACWE